MKIQSHPLPFLTQKFVSSMVCVCGILLLVVSISEYVTLYLNPKVLNALDPLTGFSYRILFAGAIVAESVIGVSAMLFPTNKIPAWGLGWLGMGLASYRLIRVFLGVQAPCKCMGEFLEWWQWGNKHENELSWAVIIIIITTAAIRLFLSDSLNTYKNKTPLK